VELNKKEKVMSGEESIKYFDKSTVSRFLELTDKTTKENNNDSNLDKLSKNESDLKSKLNLISFNNINEARKIYKQLEVLGDEMNSISHQKTSCDAKLKNTLSENVELKEALAELEIKFRLSKVKK
jgi:hypothetical protein